MSSFGCTCSVASADITFHGGTAWIYNLFSDLVADKLKDMIGGGNGIVSYLFLMHVNIKSVIENIFKKSSFIFTPIFFSINICEKTIPLSYTGTWTRNVFFWFDLTKVHYSFKVTLTCQQFFQYWQKVKIIETRKHFLDELKINYNW